MARKVDLTSKQMKYLASRSAGMSAEQSVIAAGYKGRPSVVVADLERQAFNREVSAVFESEGITLQGIAATIKAGMDAEVVESFCTKAGDVVYSKPMVDHQTRHKFVVTASDLLGLSTRARQAVAEADKPKGDGVNILVLAQRFEHMDDAQLEEAMQLMRVGQFDASLKPGDVVVGGRDTGADGKAENEAAK